MSFLSNNFINLSILDLYAEKVKLYIGRKEKSKSIFGTIITLLTMGLCLFLTWSSFEEYYNETNPKLALSTLYNTKELQINETNPFISIGFYVPKNGSKSYSNSSTDFNKVNTIKTIAIKCNNCTFDHTLMNNYCNSTGIDQIRIASLSARTSKNITDIFKTKSFCFPNFKSTLVDDDNKVKNFISSFSLYIPDSYNPNGTSTKSIY